MHAPRVALLSLLLVLGLVQATGAAVRIQVRVSALSWDSPVTQHIDDLATQSVPSADTAEETLARARSAAGSRGRFVAPAGDPRLVSPALSSGFTRSPPIA